MEKYEEGFYHLYSPGEKEPVLVYGYNCSDCNGVFVFGFNTYDGGHLVTQDDLMDSTVVVPVKIEDIRQ